MRQINPIRPQLILIGLIIGMGLILSGCQLGATDNQKLKQGLDQTESALVRPVIWLTDDKTSYQPLYPLKQAIDYKAALEYMERKDNPIGTKHLKSLFENAVSVYQQPLRMRIEYEGDVNMKYRLYRMDGNQVAEQELKYKRRNQDIIVSLDFAQIQGIKDDQSYVLELEMTSLEDETYYYLTCNNRKTDQNRNRPVLEAVDKRLKNQLTDSNVSMLGQPRITLHLPDNQTAMVKLCYNLAIRTEDGFEYYDYKEQYQYDAATAQLTQISTQKLETNRFVYNRQPSRWNLGGTAEDYPYNSLESEDGNYQAIYSQTEIVLYDRTKQELAQVYKLSAFDSDYVYDEYNNHTVEVIGVTNQGKVYFTVTGYINDHSFNRLKMGKGLYEYDDGQVLSIMFEDLLGQPSYQYYYNASNNKIYYFHNKMLYQLAMEQRKFEYIETFANGRFYPQLGVLVGQPDDSKYNTAISIVDLTGSDIKRVEIHKTGKHKRLLWVSGQGILVGNYRLEDSYEYLNREVLYAYHSLDLYDFKANIIKSYPAPTGQYYGSIVQKEEKIWGKLLNRVQRPSLNRVYTDVAQQTALYTDQAPAQKRDKLVDNWIATEVKQKAVQYSRKYFFAKQMVPLSFQKTEIRDGYYVQRQQQKIPVASYQEGLRVGQELAAASEDAHYQIIRQYERVMKVLFDAQPPAEEQYLRNVAVIAQRPELPRGCEVVSLSILLKYYLIETPDKLAFAGQLKKDFNFSQDQGLTYGPNMNLAFAGSMTDLNQKGLGVYIGPIKALADRYLTETLEAVDVTGMSFDQLINYLNNNTPVQVIVSNGYNAISAHEKELWKTEDGYMEVSNREHSVVVIGYDSNNIYYSDPSKARIDKKPTDQFRKGWEAFGNRGLVIIGKQ